MVLLPTSFRSSKSDEAHSCPPSGWDSNNGAITAHGRASSEDSWCSVSDNDTSSGEESSERSATSSTRSSGQLKQTLHKAKTLCDKWRPHGVKDCNIVSSNNNNNNLHHHHQQDIGQQSTGRLSRWFSIRRGSPNQYELESAPGDRTTQLTGKMPLLSEAEEENLTQSSGLGTMSSFPRRQLPPTLPPPPQNLTPEQLKRRYIIAAIVHSENSYVATLQRLVNDFKKPLEESSPAILSPNKISTLFHRLPEILQCHTLFRIALAEAVRTWDKDERIGDVFVASFSKSIVLDVYSGFINNFSLAMDLAKTEAKRKSALADFLKAKQISAHDRLSFFGLMVKPVQRFPQFILFLQDLLKHTPQGHHDRMSLQLALTQLESLAEMLNERKREAEQFQAFKEMLRHVSGKFAARPLSDSNRYLLREDNVTQLEFNQQGIVTKSKSRRLLLLNDLLVCVNVTPRTDEFVTNERLTLKWTHPVVDVEVQDTSASPTLSRLLTAGLNRSGSLKKEHQQQQTQHQSGETRGVDNLCREMADLMHDYEVLSRITELAGSLRAGYKELNVDTMKGLLHDVQTAIQEKDEAMSWVDSCCLQITLKNKNNKEETITFQTETPNVKKEWTTELRLAQLALDTNNSPAWEVPEQEQRPSTKMPLFVKSQTVYSSQHQTEVRCGCFYSVLSNNKSTTGRRNRQQNYLWVCTTDGVSSHISILTQQGHQAGQLKNVSSIDLVETRVTCMEFVKGCQQVDCNTVAGDTVWMGTDSGRIIIYSGGEPEKQEELLSLSVPAVCVQIRYHGDNVFVALANGSLMMYTRNNTSCCWSLDSCSTFDLGADTVSCLLPINNTLYAACGKKVSVLCAYTGVTQKSFSVLHEHVGNVNLMAHSGVGLWISLRNSSTICLYHTETFKHLQDINIASNVLRVTSPPTAASTSQQCCSNRDCVNNTRTVITVTSLMACKGLLWVGTNVGIILTIPLPRLEGVPIISGRVNISYHAHFGPISFLLALQPKTTTCRRESVVDKTKDDKKLDKETTDKIKQQLTTSGGGGSGGSGGSPVVLRRKKQVKQNHNRRTSKTLPRGLGGTGQLFSASSTSSGDTCDVYGLYGELMNCKDYDTEENLGRTYDSLRRSDPDLSAIPGKVNTLDRRVKMKTTRPRSLDLSNWSINSAVSSYSSASEDGVATNAVCNQHVKEVDDVKPQVRGSCANDPTRRTVITLMGGRGYVNWRQACCSSKSQNVNKEPNSQDAHIVVWEMKL